MRNLRNTKHDKFDFKEQAAHLTATAWDPADDSLILAFGPAGRDGDAGITLKRLSPGAQTPDEATTIASWDAPPPNPDLGTDRILSLQCFPDSKSIILVLAGGDIVVVREEPQPEQDLIEIVGSVDAAINAAAWSPDEELLAISSGAGTLLLMTRDFESVANVTLTPEDVQVSNHVSVGWGKKETQFKGRGVAKTLRDPTVPEHIDEGKVSELDDGEVTITWRGDGEYVALNSVLDSEPKRRTIRVFSREGVLESVTEPVDGLESALSWKPSGQLLAGIQRQGEKLDVVFFERNGLRHGEFSLRLSEEEKATSALPNAIDLRWNADSSALAVSMKDRVQIWTMSNYHYYLKQEVILGTSGADTTRSFWHPDKGLQIACAAANDLRLLSYAFDVCHGSLEPPQDIGLVAVIDGKRLKVTPLRTANVPPPMAFDEVELPDQAIDLTVSDDGKEIAVLHHTTVTTFSCDYGAKPPLKATLASTLARPSSAALQTQGNTVDRDSSLEVQGVLFCKATQDRLFYNTPNTATPNNPGLEHTCAVNRSDPGHATWRSSEDCKVSIALSEAGVLRVDSARQNLRISGCTSFVVTSTHLIYTTSQHLLKFVHLHDGSLEIPADEPEKDERCRSVERGAKIITVMPSVHALVLQMPRGNLETTFPRALVLAGIRKNLKNLDGGAYKKSFSICRTHRVDMNILHDYAPVQFMRDVALFVKQLKKAEYIDLFLSSLSDEDVSQTLYRDTLTTSHQSQQGTMVHPRTEVEGLAQSASGKTNRVCDAFLEVLQKQMPASLQNVVTAHVCKSPPDLEAGLRLVSELRREQKQENLEQAVEHICFLADVNHLYDTALGIYDLDVALLVAQQSQKDPREYLPYLQNLHDMESLRQQFAIDNDLKRYRKALSHLHALTDFEEVKTYTSRHELYSLAIELYRYDNSRLLELMRLYADFLSSRNRYKEAGIAYEYIGDNTAAYEAYRSVTMWRECLANAALVPISTDELAELAQDLATSLEEAKDFTASAYIHLDYLSDLDNATRLLCRGYQFAEAIRTAAVRQRSDLLSTAVDSTLIETSATTTELLAEMKSQLHAQVPRLRELREKKSEDPMAFLDGAEGGDGVDIPDNLSLAPTDATTSAGTFLTRYTNRSSGTLATNATRKTSKNRRREERKKARGKKGTVYEEEYLVNSIARLIERMNSVGDDTAKLVEGLMRRAMRERAVAVQSAMDDVVEACRACTDEVFNPPRQHAHPQPPAATAEEAVQRPWGGEGVLWETLTGTGQKAAAPTLKAFERLNILG